MTGHSLDRCSGASGPESVPRRLARLAPAAAGALSLAVALVAFGTGRVPFNADQAMVGLMAGDILAGARPVFFMGSEYAGTVEPHAVAVAFALLGPSAAVQRWVVALEYAAFAGLLAAAAGRWFGQPAALAAGLYAALPPAYLLFKGLTSDGHYGPVLLVGAACALVQAKIARDAEQGAGPGARLLLLGLLHGVGLWVSPLCASLLAPSAVLLAGPLVRRFVTWRGLAHVIAGACVGSLPWWLRNLDTGFASLRVPGSAPVDGPMLVDRFASLVRDGLPLVLGPSAIGSAAGSAAWAVSFAAAVTLGVAAVAAAGALRRSEDPVVRTGLVASAALVAATVILALVVRGQDELPAIRNFREPRLLLLAYVGLVPLLGYALSRLAQRWWLVAAVGTALAAVHASGWARMPRRTGLENGEAREVAIVLEGLLRNGVRSVYSPYWGAYPVTFFSRGRVVGTPFGSNSSVRREGDRRRADADPSPGFLLWPPESDRLEAWLRDGGFAFRRTELGRLSLFESVDVGALSALRSCLCVPPVIRPGCITWRRVEGPASVAAGDVAVFDVRFRNETLAPWPPGVNLGYRWRGAGGGGVEETGRRTAVGPGPDVGREGSLSARVVADVPPGRYELVFDLVIEGVTWFEWKGVAPATRTVDVVAGEAGERSRSGSPAKGAGP